jgi:putative transposase
MRTTRSAAIQLLLRATSESSENLRLLRQLDELYMEYPFFGSRRMTVTLAVNRKRIQRLMGILGIEALYPKPNLSRPAPGHEW